MTEGLAGLLDDVLRIAVDISDADDAVVYIEEEKDKFAPIAIFSIGKIKNVCFWVGKEEHLLSITVDKWPEIYVTSDQSVFESLPVVYRDRPPKSFLAIPFKVGSRRALFCLSSGRLDVFPEKIQKILFSIVGLIKELLIEHTEVELATFYKAKYNMFKKLLDLVLQGEAVPESVVYNLGEMFELDFVGLFVKENEEIVPVAVFSKGAPKTSGLKITPRSIVYLSFERTDPYIILDEEDEFLPDLKGYGFVIPYRMSVSGRRYSFVVVSSIKDYLTEDLLDVFEVFGKLFVNTIDLRTSSEEVVSPSDLVLNRMRILLNRSLKEQSKLLVILIELKQFVRDIARKSYWEIERVMWDVVNLVKSRFPRFFVRRISDSVIIMMDLFPTRDEAKEAVKEVREFFSDVDTVDIYNLEKFIFPDEVSTYEELIRRIGDLLKVEPKQEAKRRLFF